MSDEWPDAKVTKLHQLWAEGHSTAEIGRRINKSKNVVVGKAHREGLFRGTPIKTSGAPPRPKGPKPGTTIPLPGLASLERK